VQTRRFETSLPVMLATNRRRRSAKRKMQQKKRKKKVFAFLSYINIHFLSLSFSLSFSHFFFSLPSIRRILLLSPVTIEPKRVRRVS